MLRISHYLRALAQPATKVLGARSASGKRPPVVIWNLLRRCNLTCKHCYATSADSEYRDELDTAEALKVIDDLFCSSTASIPAARRRSSSRRECARPSCQG